MRHLRWSILLPGLLGLLLSCESAPASAPEEALLEPTELGPNAALIRNPVDQGIEQLDTVNVARLTFSGPLEYKFGEVKEGTVVQHEFAFTNTGTVPLLITDARSTCGCTVGDYPKEPVAPGGESVVSVTFDTNHKYGRQRKAVSLTANTYPAKTILYMDGTVINEK